MTGPEPPAVRAGSGARSRDQAIAVTYRAASAERDGGQEGDLAGGDAHEAAEQQRGGATEEPLGQGDEQHAAGEREGEHDAGQRRLVTEPPGAFGC